MSVFLTNNEVDRIVAEIKESLVKFIKGNECNGKLLSNELFNDMTRAAN